MNRKGNINGMTVIIAIVVLIIGLTIVDGMTTEMTNLLGTTNESTGTANASGYLAGTLAQDWTSSQTATCNNTVTSNVTFDDDAGSFVFDGADCAGATTLVSYSYQPDGYFSSSLSRTVLTYIVPIGIIGALSLAVLLG